MLADDAVLFREGMARILADVGFEVTGQAGDGERLLGLVRADPPDVAVIDLRMPPGFSAEGIDAAVIDPVTVKPLDEALIRGCAEKTGLVVTAENHNKIGGLTSAVQAAVCGLPLRFGTVAIEDEFGEVGPQDYLRKRFDLTAEHIARTVRELRA